VIKPHGKSFFGAETRPSDNETNRPQPGQCFATAHRSAELAREPGKRRQSRRRPDLPADRVGARQGNSEGRSARKHSFALQVASVGTAQCSEVGAEVGAGKVPAGLQILLDRPQRFVILRQFSVHECSFSLSDEPPPALWLLLKKLSNFRVGRGIYLGNSGKSRS